MTNDERITAWNQILKYNAKKWSGSLGAILLHKAEALITYERNENKRLQKRLDIIRVEWNKEREYYSHSNNSWDIISAELNEDKV